MEMQAHTDNTWERSLARVAQQYEYPATPDISRRLTQRRREAATRRARPRPLASRVAWSLVLLALVVAALLVVPVTRAAILSFMTRIGAIDIYLDEAAPTVTPAAPATPVASPVAGGGASARPTPAGHALSLLDLGEPTTLADAARLVGFAPRIPAALGEPDEVYLHRGVDLPVVTLVWRGADGAPLSLTQIGVARFAEKLIGERQLEATTVDGDYAVWLPGPHRLQLLGDWQPNAPLIASNVLIWVEGEVTYRLEGALAQDEAVRIAESLGE